MPRLTRTRKCVICQRKRIPITDKNRTATCGGVCSKTYSRAVRHYVVRRKKREEEKSND